MEEKLEAWRQRKLKQGAKVAAVRKPLRTVKENVKPQQPDGTAQARKAKPPLVTAAPPPQSQPTLSSSTSPGATQSSTRMLQARSEESAHREIELLQDKLLEEKEKSRRIKRDLKTANALVDTYKAEKDKLVDKFAEQTKVFLERERGLVHRVAELEKIASKLAKTQTAQVQTDTSFTPDQQDQINTLQFAYEVLWQENFQLKTELKENGTQVAELQQAFEMLQSQILARSEKQL